MPHHARQACSFESIFCNGLSYKRINPAREIRSLWVRCPQNSLSTFAQFQWALTCHTDEVGSNMMTRFKMPARRARALFLKAGLKPKTVEVRSKQVIFAQGELGNAVFYIDKGCVKFSVTSKQRKKATIALLGPGDFLGVGCIAAAQSSRLGSAVAITACTLLRMKKKEIQHAIHQKHRFSEALISYLLAYIAQIHDDLTDQVLSSSEKRLARTLLLLADFGGNDNSDGLVPKISQQVLAEMVGTTRSRVSFFMNRFRKLGVIDYNGILRVHRLRLLKMRHSLVT